MIITQVKFFLRKAVLFITASVCLQSISLANNMQMLDTLTQRGILTEIEAKNIAKSMAEVPVAISKPQQKISISGRLQAQYAYLENEIRSGHDAGMSNYVNGFILRRMIVSFKAELSETFGSIVAVDYSLPHYASNIYVYKHIDADYLKGEMRLGYLKTNFVVEEYTSSGNLYCIERSVATNFWSGSNGERKLGFGGMMVGAWWYGEIESVKGLNYFLGISNSENYEIDIRDIRHGGAHNVPSIWAAISYKKDISDSVNFHIGMNSGFGSLVNKVPYDKHPTEIIGFNPFLAIKGEDFRINTELMFGRVENGRHTNYVYDSCSPFGFNFMCEYLFNAPIGRWGPVFRYSYLDTDGRGVSTSDGLRKAVTIDSDFYNEAQGFYIGINWYISGNDLKFQFGYEFSQFKEEINQSGNEHLNADSFRVQMQIQF